VTPNYADKNKETNTDLFSTSPAHGNRNLLPFKFLTNHRLIPTYHLRHFNVFLTALIPKHLKFWQFPKCIFLIIFAANRLLLLSLQFHFFF